MGCWVIARVLIGILGIARVLYLQEILGGCWGVAKWLLGFFFWGGGGCQSVAIWFLGVSVIVRVLLCIDGGLGDS